MVRSGKYNRHGRTTGPTYLSEDNYKLKIIMHIYANGESYKNKIKHDSAGGLTSIEGTDLNLYLAKMKKERWIKEFQSPHSKNVKVYKLNKKGREIAETLEELIKKDHPILKLPVFYDVKFLGSTSV